MSRATPPSRADFRHWQRITLRWADNDAYGHVNNTVYYQWFDSAVNRWLVSEDLLDIMAGDPIALVARTSCDYFGPVSFPGDVDVGLAVAQVGRSSVRYSIGVFKSGSADAAASGEFVHVAVDRARRTAVPWPEAWREAFRKLS